MKVKNVGRGVARGCIGKLVEVRTEDDRRRGDRDPIQLAWAGVALDNQFLPIDLYRNDSQFLGIVYATEKDSVARLVTDQQPRGFDQTLEPLVHDRVAVAAYATNAGPAVARFDVYFVGFTLDLQMTRLD